jgi:hypothetical protein
MIYWGILQPGFHSPLSHLSLKADVGLARFFPHPDATAPVTVQVDLRCRWGVGDWRPLLYRQVYP